METRVSLKTLGKIGCLAIVVLLFSDSLFGQASGSVAKTNAHAKNHVIAFYSFGEASADKSMHGRMISLINEDGTGERFPELNVPGQFSWLIGPQFADGRRVVLASFGNAGVSQVRGLGGTTRFRTWIYDRQTGKLQEILNKGSLPPDTRPVLLLPGEKRMIVAATPKDSYSVLAVDLDGTNPVELVPLTSGFAYGISLSPDKKHLAFHITGGQWGDLKKPSAFSLGHYNINVLDLETRERILVAGKPGHLYFGPQWSPNGQWLAYLDCPVEKYPTHFRGDVCVGKTDGTENRVLTEGQPHWFGSNWGSAEYRGGGSTMVSWNPDGKSVLFSRLLPDSVTDLSKGGTQLCLIDPVTRKVTELTPAEESIWVHHASWSRDGRQIVYTRGRWGYPAELWITNSDGSGQRMLSKGYKQRGVDLGGQFWDK